MTVEFKKGQRARLSQEGIDHGLYPHQRDRLGTISRDFPLRSWSRYVSVVWDGNRAPQAFHPSLIEAVQAEVEL